MTQSLIFRRMARTALRPVIKRRLFYSAATFAATAFFSKTAFTRCFAESAEPEPKSWSVDSNGKRVVLFAYDNSFGSEFAVKWALANFFKNGDLIILVNVVPDLPNDPIGFTFDSFKFLQIKTLLYRLFSR
ncbi:hypothetical protein MHBO_002052 [Bonamia ostreae]|uniref:UspA domain-containing protein n=1 Tax=Bonamia ostreae TaxID=126728 RepID=A0ABV2AL53_9EUKA